MIFWTVGERPIKDFLVWLPLLLFLSVLDSGDFDAFLIYLCNGS